MNTEKENQKKNEEELLSGKMCPLIDPYFEKDSDTSVMGLRNINNKQNIEGLDEEITKIRSEVIKGKRAEYTQAIKTELAERNSRTDKLTGLFNRAYFDEEIKKQFDRAERYKKSTFSFLLIDIDKFKPVNDILGHQAGDTILKKFADILMNEKECKLRDSDILTRYGGEEFGVILPETSNGHAMEAAERIRANMEKYLKPEVHRIAKEQGKEDEIPRLLGTISIGVASYYGEKEGQKTVNDIIEQADNGLYVAKKEGRNKTIDGVNHAKKLDLNT